MDFQRIYFTTKMFTVLVHDKIYQGFISFRNLLTTILEESYIFNLSWEFIFLSLCVFLNIIIF